MPLEKQTHQISQQDLIQQGYSPEHAARVGVETVTDADQGPVTFSKEELLAQGFSPEAAANHPANAVIAYKRRIAEQNSVRPTTNALREGARLVVKDGVVMIPTEVTELRDNRKTGVAGNK